MRQQKKIGILLGCFLLSAQIAGAAGVFSIGDTGESVREIQKMLSRAGVRVKIDGYYGRETEAAIREFQLKNNLVVDGVLGNVTYKALSKIAKDGYDVSGDPHAEILDSYRWSPDAPKRQVDWKTKEISAMRAKSIMEEAQKYVGVPYQFGGTTPGGFDCAGFMQYIFRKHGLGLPRTADEQYELGDYVEWSALRPGDLVFFSTYTDGVSHSGLYLGNGSFISATTSSGVMVADMTSGYWYDCYVGAKRIL